MYRHLLFAVPALLLATSCVRSPPAQVVLDIPPIVRRAPALLRQLDLNVPKDIARAALWNQDVAAAAEPLATAAPPFLAQTQTAEDATRAVDCLTAAVYYEARSETDEGERAVAQVVLNRVRDRAFPSSICGVVYQGSERRSGCQFSFTCDGSMDRPVESRAWARARAVATGALAGLVYAPVGSATFYHADYVSPWWAGSMAQVATIGAHIFYRWRGAMESALAFRQSYSGSERLPTRSSPLALAATGMEGAPLPSSSVNGGIEMVGSVTIHRGRAEEGATSPNPDAPKMVAIRDSADMGGVRIHRGQYAPALISTDAPSPRHIRVSDQPDPT